VPIEGLSSLSLSVPTVSNKVCPLMQSMPLLTGESLSPINFNVADCHPIVFNYVKKSKAFIVCVDIYETTTAKKSDLFIKVEAGRANFNVCINKGINLIGCIGRLC
jgi:hypothetical protein